MREAHAKPLLGFRAALNRVKSCSGHDLCGKERDWRLIGEDCVSWDSLYVRNGKYEKVPKRKRGLNTWDYVIQPIPTRRAGRDRIQLGEAPWLGAASGHIYHNQQKKLGSFRKFARSL